MGIQVANNKESQMMLKLIRHPKTNKLYFEITPHGMGLIRNAYTPIGGVLIYPREWGEEKAKKYMIDYIISDQTIIISKAEKYIEELKEIPY